MILSLILFLILFAPLIWELWDDRKGDLNKERDVLVRIVIMSFAAFFVTLLTGDMNNLIGIYIGSFFLSLAIHFALFDYILNFILIKNGTLEPPKGIRYSWFTYSAKKGVIDNISWWKNANPWVKLFIRVCCLSMALIIYFV